MKVAEFLAQHPKVARVHYPGLQSHPGHKIAARQMSEFGGMLSFETKNGHDAAMSVAAKTKIFIRATSLGGVESLIEHRASIEGPGTTSPEGLLRVSIGLENADDLIEDLDQALGNRGFQRYRDRLPQVGCSDWRSRTAWPPSSAWASI